MTIMMIKFYIILILLLYFNVKSFIVNPLIRIRTSTATSTPFILNSNSNSNDIIENNSINIDLRHLKQEYSFINKDKENDLQWNDFLQWQEIRALIEVILILITNTITL